MKYTLFTLLCMFLYGTLNLAHSQNSGGYEQATLIHSFPDTNVFPESVAIDHNTGNFYVGSVKHGTIYKGKIGTTTMEVFAPAGVDGRTMATGMFFKNDRLVVAGRQTGQIFVYNTTNGKLLAHLSNGKSGVSQTFLNDATFAVKGGSAFVTDSHDSVLYQVVPTKK